MEISTRSCRPCLDMYVNSSDVKGFKSLNRVATREQTIISTTRTNPKKYLRGYPKSMTNKLNTVVDKRIDRLNNEYKLISQGQNISDTVLIL